MIDNEFAPLYWQELVPFGFTDYAVFTGKLILYSPFILIILLAILLDVVYQFLMQ